jgi:hypothetical protein
VPTNRFQSFCQASIAGEFSPALLKEIDRLPPSTWRTITLDVPRRKYRTPRIYEQKACPRQRNYRQFFIRDLGHEQPTILLTNDARSTIGQLVIRYAKRMLIENALAGAVRFFHIDALSSSVGFKVDFDMALLVLASGFYRLMAWQCHRNSRRYRVVCYAYAMRIVSYHRHRFPPAIIQHAVWLYFRFNLSLRNVEEMMAERGIEASFETVRRWTAKFGFAYTARLRMLRHRSCGRWHLDEVFSSINGQKMYLGAPSTQRARYSRSWSKNAETSGRP